MIFTKTSSLFDIGSLSGRQGKEESKSAYFIRILLIEVKSKKIMLYLKSLAHYNIPCVYSID